jgi:hypothetical protein
LHQQLPFINSKFPISGADFPGWVNSSGEKRGRIGNFTSNIRKMGSMSEIWIVLVELCPMEGLQVSDRLRPGIILFWAVVLFMCMGIVSSEEVLAGFRSKDAIAVVLLFLVSGSVRWSDALECWGKRLLSGKYGITVRRGHTRIQPTIASTSAFLSNTVVVVLNLDRIRLEKLGTSSRFLSTFAIFLRSSVT